MPSTAAARKGDTSSHGGTIIGACSPTVDVNGIPQARTGDLHSCPILGHGVTPLTGTAVAKADGLVCVRVGDTAACGAVINSGSPTVSLG